MLAKTLERKIKKPGKKSKGLKFVHFVKKARKDKESMRKKRPVLKPTDWQMRVDLRQRIEFPPEKVITNKRPDIAPGR